LVKHLNLKATRTVSKTPSRWVLKHSDTWTLNSVQYELTNDLSINSLRGSHTTSFKHFTQINKTFSDTTYLTSPYTAISKQVDWVRISRWLYRYNLLHRRTITSSHKMTLTKRLINSGFYDSSLNTRNIHVSSLSSLNPNFDRMISFLTRTSYGEFFRFTDNTPGSVNMNLVSTKITSPKLISFSEESFFWFTKRFYLLNTLPSLGRSSNFTQRSLSHLTIPTSESSFILQNTFLSQNTVNLLREKTFNTSCTKNITPALSSRAESQILPYFTNFDLFSYDFTTSAIQILRNPTSTNLTYAYYSPTFNSNVKLDTLSTFTINKLK
jgi:hypothetical protein